MLDGDKQRSHRANVGIEEKESELKIQIDKRPVRSKRDSREKLFNAKMFSRGGLLGCDAPFYMSWEKAAS